MQVHTFIAESITDAVAQIRDTLGPAAVVLNVRRLPNEGLARLWQKPRLEVLAHVPEKIAELNPAPPPAQDEVQVSALAELRAEMREMRERLQKPMSAPLPVIAAPTGMGRRSDEPAASSDGASEILHPPRREAGDWRVGALLEQTGLLPVNAARIVDELCATHGAAAPIALADEIELARQVLAAHWKPLRGNAAGPHVFVGAPGAGKTTVLCKWLAQAALAEGRSAAVWRLDGHVANTAESLSVFGEILSVSVERCAPLNGEWPEAELLLVDLPGVNPTDGAALRQLTQRLAAIPKAQVHLVLNAAYETTLLLAQARAFSVLPIADVIVTHLDEEPRWGKLWNLVLGTNCTVRALAAGQNIPGEFAPATPDRIFAHQFPRKSAVIAAGT